MADRYLITEADILCVCAVTESQKLDVQRKVAFLAEKEAASAARASEWETLMGELKKRELLYEEEYAAEDARVAALRREAEEKGGFYREDEAKLLFVIRIKGIKKLAPKPRKILQLLRLLRLHNGVFVKATKSMLEMVRLIEPYITYGYPSLETVRKLIYSRGYGRYLNPESRRTVLNMRRTQLTDNRVVSESLGKLGIHGVEDIVNQIYTVGPHFREVNNFLCSFKLTCPRGGFIAKRRAFNELRKGDWGNRENLINELIERMI